MPSNPIKTKTKTVTRADGSSVEVPVYWFRIEAGRGADGRRIQIYRSFDKLKDAKAEYAKLTHEVNTKTHIAPGRLTLNEYLDGFVTGHVRNMELASVRNLHDGLRPARERLGERKLQSIEKADIERLVDWMSTSGRKRGGKPGTGLGPRTVILTLSALSTALDMAVMERKIPMNPVRLVKRPKLTKPVHTLWTTEEETKFFDFVAGDRLATVIDLFALGLRPEEICGLRWDHLDLDAGTADIGKIVRTLVTGVGADEKTAKTKAGERTLPLGDGLASALKAWQKVQKAEQLAAGSAYSKGSHGGYVLCDELGQPFLPDKLRRYMHALMKKAGVSKVTPYEAMRHAAATRLANATVPGHQIAAWMGHKNANFTIATYVHARPEDLASVRDSLAR